MHRVTTLSRRSPVAGAIHLAANRGRVNTIASATQTHRPPFARSPVDPIHTNLIPCPGPKRNCFAGGRKIVGVSRSQSVSPGGVRVERVIGHIRVLPHAALRLSSARLRYARPPRCRRELALSVTHVPGCTGYPTCPPARLRSAEHGVSSRDSPVTRHGVRTRKQPDAWSAWLSRLATASHHRFRGRGT